MLLHVLVLTKLSSGSLQSVLRSVTILVSVNLLLVLWPHVNPVLFVCVSVHSAEFCTVQQYTHKQDWINMRPQDQMILITK